MSTTLPSQARLDRPVLTGNLVSGAAWVLLSLVLTSSVALTLVIAAYLAASSLFLAATYAREALTRRQEVLAWAVPWLAAGLLLLLLSMSSAPGPASSVGEVALWAGPAFVLCLVLATPGYLAWQLSALAVRQLIAWRSTAPTPPLS